jgi:proteasome assembly chaperone (PAC2) family protein
VIELTELPRLSDPVMIAAFEGWNDAGEAASATIEHLCEVWEAEVFAALDPEDYYDFQVNRPLIGMDDEGQRRVTWPTTRLLWAHVPGIDRDVIVVDGIEPSMRWRSYTIELLELADQLGVSTLVTVGALLADVPHTRPIPVTMTSDDPTLLARLPAEQSRYEGPTGIVGVLQAAATDAGIPAASLWAAVPHYVAVVPNPKGALALLRKLETLVGVTVDATELESSAVDYERQVSRAVEMDPDVQAFVERLERAADEEEATPDPGELPSGDLLAREFQRFLRQRGADQP